MNQNQLNNYNNASIQQLLQYQLQYPRQNSHIATIVFGKAKLESCNPRSLEMTLALLQRDGQIWLKVIERFSELQFKLTFACCINNYKTYQAIMIQVIKQGQIQHKAKFQEKIQQALDLCFNNKILNFLEYWGLYTLYLHDWIVNLPFRTIFLLQKIQNRLKHPYNVYSQLGQNQKIDFIKLLSEIISIQEEDFKKKLQLRNFWNSIPYSMEYLKQQILENDILNKSALKLGILTSQKQKVIEFFMSTCKLSMLEQIYINNIQRLVTELINTEIIDYKKYDINSLEDLIILQNSLICHIKADDFPSLMQQLLSTLSSNIPNFLSSFIAQSIRVLQKNNLSEIQLSDIILKLCILSKQIIQKNNQQFFNQIKELVDKLIDGCSSHHNVHSYIKTSQILQIKTIKLMHYFKQALPQAYFQKYHQVIFKILKKSLSQDNSMNQQNNISFLECIQILQDETDIKQGSCEHTIKNKKFSNKVKVSDLTHKNISWISDQILNLLDCQPTYIMNSVQFQETKYRNIYNHNKGIAKLFIIYRDILTRYPSIKQRDYAYLLKVLCKKFGQEFDRLNALQFSLRTYEIILIILQCIKIAIQGVEEDYYIQSQQQIVPIIKILTQPYTIEFENEIFSLIPIMIQKANIITPQINNFLLYTKNLYIKNNTTIDYFQDIIFELCKSSIVRSIIAEWNGLVTFYSNIFREYLEQVRELDSIKVLNDSWKKSCHLIQLFLQTYEQEFVTSENNQNIQILFEMNAIINQLPNCQQKFQLLMTIHHINPKIKINPYEITGFVENYKCRYSINMIHITLVDILVRGFQQHIFDFENSKNQIYNFLTRFCEFVQYTKSQANRYQNSDYDKLPLNKIKVQIYMAQGLQQLYKDKKIDIQEYIELKNKLLDQRYLIKKSLFQ